MVFSWEMAEELAATHMRTLGFEGARRTPPGTDRGIDVVAEGAVAQVKFLSAPVGGPDIQRFRGAAHLVPTALFYSASGYTRAAKTLADELGVGLFEFDQQNNVRALNYTARVTAAPDTLVAPPAPDLTETEVEAQGLLAEIDLFRFQVKVWRWTCARGRTKYWDNATDPPDPKELLLPDLLDLLPLDEARSLAADSVREVIDISRTSLDLQHSTDDHLKARGRQELDAQVQEFNAAHPDDPIPWRRPNTDFPTIPALRDGMGQLAARLEAMKQKLYQGTSHPTELSRVARNEAWSLMRDDPDRFSQFHPEQAVPLA